MMHKKAHKQFAEDKQTKDMDYWKHVLWSDDRTKTSVSCLQSSMVVGVSWSGAAWVLPALGSYSSSYSTFREPWMPKCTVIYWSRVWSPPFGDIFIFWAQFGHFHLGLYSLLWPAVYTLMAVELFLGDSKFIQAVHSLLNLVAKCHFLSVVTWKGIIKYLQKCEGVYSLLWDTVDLYRYL